jgi:hypothetical protein
MPSFGHQQQVPAHLQAAQGPAIRLATNAPRDWPKIPPIPWSQFPAFNGLQLFWALDEAFANTPLSVPDMSVQVLIDEGVLVIPILVEEPRGKGGAVHYVRATEEESAHYNGFRAALKKQGYIGCVYFAPAPLPATNRVSDPTVGLSPDILRPLEEIPHGQYAIWWRDAADPDFAKSPLAQAVAQVFNWTDGLEVPLVEELGNRAKVRGNLEGRFVCVLEGPEDVPVLVTHSEKEGLAFRFRIGTPKQYCIRFLRAYLRYARQRLQRTGPGVTGNNWLKNFSEAISGQGADAENIVIGGVNI